MIWAGTARPGTVDTMSRTPHSLPLVAVGETYRTLWRFLNPNSRRRRGGPAVDGDPAYLFPDHEGATGSDVVTATVADAVGWKVAVIADPFDLIFHGYSWGGYGHKSRSRCLYRNHASPQFGCRCGFHAYRDRADAVYRLDRRHNAVLLRVGLYGTLIEHHKGWRAEEQDVLTIHLPRGCSARRCVKTTVMLSPEHNSWRASCVDHAAAGAITLAELRRRQGVDVIADL